MENKNEIISKANFCLGCINKPCSDGCPLGNDTEGFISLVKNEKFEEAYRLLCNTTAMPAICGRICPHSKQCQGSCIRRFKFDPVEIGEIEAYVGNLAIKNGWKFYNNENIVTDKKVAIVGGGPAGLTCAAFLARNGVNVTIFEKHNYLGGLLVHGIPDFRLDRKVINDTISKILERNIEVRLNSELGKDFSLNDLEKEFDAMFLSFGGNVHNKMGISGENLTNVFGGNEFLENNIKLNLAGKTAYVCGGGNVAMDTSRTLKRQGCKKVVVVYRRSENEMPAERKEIEDAKKEGVEFLFQHNIVKINGEKEVQEIELIKTELIKKEGDTRLSPVNIEGSNYTLPADYVFMALGSQTEESLVKNLDLVLSKYNQIVIDENCKTSNPKIFAGGDNSSFKKTGTVAWAARAGRNASEEILRFLNLK